MNFKLLTVLFAVAFLPLRSTYANDQAKPNVVIIYSDDQGTYDLNCYGSEDLATPHLDGLARRGIRFAQMYSPSAIVRHPVPD